MCRTCVELCLQMHLSPLSPSLFHLTSDGLFHSQSGEISRAMLHAAREDMPVADNFQDTQSSSAYQTALIKEKERERSEQIDKPLKAAVGLVSRLREWRRLQGHANGLEALLAVIDQEMQPTAAELARAQQDLVAEMAATPLARSAVHTPMYTIPEAGYGQEQFIALQIDPSGMVVGPDRAPPKLCQRLSVAQLATMRAELDSAATPLALVVLASEARGMAGVFATEGDTLSMRNRAEVARTGVRSLLAGQRHDLTRLDASLGGGVLARIENFLQVDTSVGQAVECWISVCQKELDEALAAWKVPLFCACLVHYSSFSGACRQTA